MQSPMARGGPLGEPALFGMGALRACGFAFGASLMAGIILSSPSCEVDPRIASGMLARMWVWVGAPMGSVAHIDTA